MTYARRTTADAFAHALDILADAARRTMRDLMRTFLTFLRSWGLIGTTEHLQPPIHTTSTTPPTPTNTRNTRDQRTSIRAVVLPQNRHAY